jgi:integrase
MDNNDRQLWDVFEREYVRLAIRGCSDNTRRLYKNSIGNLRAFLGREPMLSDLTDDILTCFSSWFIERGRSGHTANKCVGQVCALWRYCARKGLVAKWPDVELEKTPLRDPMAWQKHELRRLGDSIAKEEGQFLGIQRAAWWRALHLLAWDTGERIGALMGLDWPNVDLDAGWVRFPAEIRKGGKRDKTFRLHAETLAALRTIKRPDGNVLPWPYSSTYLYRLYDRILKRAGLPTDRKSKFHRLRKSVASWLEFDGGDATELLDHSSRKVTKAYLDPRIVYVRHASEVLFRPGL